MDKLKIKEATSFKDKLLGFMFKKSADHAILFEDCGAIHTFFMRFDLNVIFLDKNKKILKEIKKLRPWRIAYCPKAYYVLEIPLERHEKDKK